MSVELTRVTNGAAHTASVGALAGTIANVLPPLLAVLGSLLAVIWYAVQIYESKTVQRWAAERRRHKH